MLKKVKRIKLGKQVCRRLPRCLPETGFGLWSFWFDTGQARAVLFN